MIALTPQFIKDSNGNKTMVILPIAEFEQMLDGLDELDDIELYDEAKKNDTGERISMDDYLLKRKQKNAQLQVNII